NRTLVLGSWIAQTLFMGLVKPQAHRPPTTLRPLPHNPIAIAKPHRTTVFIAFKSGAAVAGSQPKFHFLRARQRRAMRPPQVSSIRRHRAAPAAFARLSAVQPTGPAPN